MNAEDVFEEAAELFFQELFDQAVTVLKKVPANHIWTVPQLILKGRLIQLSDATNWDLEDAEASLLEEMGFDVEAIEKGGIKAYEKQREKVKKGW